MIATIEVGKLLELVWAAALAGVGVAVCFSIIIIGAALVYAGLGRKRAGLAA